MDQGNRRFRPVVIAVAVLGVALLAAAFVSEAVFHQSIDPTESTFAVTLHNDTPSAVVLKQCDTKCDSFHERDQLRPGASVRVNTSSDNVANWWAVTDAAGRTLVQRSGLRAGPAVAMTTLAALVVFLGGWLFFDLYVVFREGARLVRRPAPAT